MMMEAITLKPILILFCHHQIQLVGLSSLISPTKIFYVFPISQHPCYTPQLFFNYQHNNNNNNNNNSEQKN
jgi:hypothetical protein